MKPQLIKIEIEIVVLLIVLLIIGVFVGDPLVLILMTTLFTAYVVSDFRVYQESDEFINSMYK